jgi:aspartate 4-decarboxylase
LPVTTVDYGKVEQLSPFELKDQLMWLASSHADRMMLNAGRGNPNFLATIPRHGFFQLGLFALREAERSFAYMPEGIGGHPQEAGLEARFESFVADNRDVPGVAFLNAAVAHFARSDRPVGAGVPTRDEHGDSWLHLSGSTPDAPPH